MAGTGSELQNRITEAAVHCFQAKGYDDVSVNDICDAAGIARSTFYRAFSSKMDVVRYLFEHTDANSIVSIEELLAAHNDFERMWIIGDRYITLTKQLGVNFCRTLMRMTVNGEIDLLGLGHSVDAWFTRLTSNCQKAGIIRSREPAEILGAMFVDATYLEIYKWCSCGGNYPIRARARQVTERIADLAPNYRWTTEQAASADK